MLALTPPRDAHDLFLESGMAEVCPPRDIPAIVSALRRLMQSADGMQPNEALRARFDRRNLTKQLATILDGLNSHEPGVKASPQ